MADTPAASTPAATASTPADQSASETAVFDKFVSQHAADVAAELGGKSGNASNPARAVGSAARPARVGAPAAGASADAARVRSGDPDTGAERADSRPGAGEADDAGAAASRPGADEPEEGSADGEAAAASKEPAAPLSEADAVALARKAHASGDTAELDRALKAIFPGSKGLSEFAVDGKRYGEFRVTTSKAQKKLDARASELDTREQNVSRGLAMVEQLVARYQPIEQLLVAAQGDDPDAFVELIEKATKKPLNDTIKRHLDRKLGKPVDPEVDALRRELASEKQARLAREQKERDAQEHQARTREIQGHLAFLDQTLSAHSDPRIVELVKTNEGMRAIFFAQKAAYDPRTGSTITPERAALQVIEAKAKELEPWQRVLAPKALPAAATETPATPPTPRATPLGNRGAAAASGSGARQLSDNEMFEKYERLQKLAGD